MLTNHQIILANYPEHKVQAHHFQLVSGPLGKPAANEVLIQNQWLSVDPYMKGPDQFSKILCQKYRYRRPYYGRSDWESIGEQVQAIQRR